MIDDPFAGDINKDGIIQEEEANLQQLHHEMYKLLDDRLADRIPLDDPYWTAKKKFDEAYTKLVTKDK